MTTSAIVAITAVAMIIAEHRRKARTFPRVRRWLPRALLFNGAQCAVAFIGALSWDLWMDGHGSLFHLEGATGIVVGYLVTTFVYYWWHRARHEIRLLWNVFHQLHHSPQRIEIITSFYKHPLEIIVNGLLTASITYLALGLSAEASALVVLVTGLAELFYHWNIATPYWLGFIFQRPESHCVHHQRGRHSHNYSDLPLWDWLFGTLENPRHFASDCGFTAGREQRVIDMLLARNVNEKRTTTPRGTSLAKQR